MILGLVGAVLLCVGGFGAGAAQHHYSAWLGLRLFELGVLRQPVGWVQLASAAPR